MSSSITYHSFSQSLIEKGFLTPAKRGRPAIYATDEERRSAHRQQQKLCQKRSKDRLREALQRMLDETPPKGSEQPND